MSQIDKILVLSPYGTETYVSLAEATNMSPGDALQDRFGYGYWGEISFNPLIRIFDYLREVLDSPHRISPSMANEKVFLSFFRYCPSGVFEHWMDQVSALFSSSEVDLLTLVRLALKEEDWLYLD